MRTGTVGRSLDGWLLAPGWLPLHTQCTSLSLASVRACDTTAWSRRGGFAARRFMPTYEVVERHHVRVVAPVETAFSAACDMYLQQSAVVRAIFKGRELILGGKPEGKTCPLGLVDQAKAWGWGILAEDPGERLSSVGATQPWLANPVFRVLLPDKLEVFPRARLFEDCLDIAR